MWISGGLKGGVEKFVKIEDLKIYSTVPVISVVFARTFGVLMRYFGFQQAIVHFAVGRKKKISGTAIDDDLYLPAFQLWYQADH